jgi:hypothetical protein
MAFLLQGEVQKNSSQGAGGSSVGECLPSKWRAWVPSSALQKEEEEEQGRKGEGKEEGRKRRRRRKKKKRRTRSLENHRDARQAWTSILLCVPPK